MSSNGSRQSKTLAEAVTTYRHRYHRDPPKGFDAWYNWARANNVTFIDDVRSTLDTADSSTTKSIEIPTCSLR